MRRWRFCALCVLWLLAACAPTGPSESPAPVVVDTEEASGETALATDPQPEVEAAPDRASGPDNPVPVLSDDAIWGPIEAPVTVVWFTDLKDPFCLRVLPTLQHLIDKFGADIRIVVKHNPLPFHEMAEPAALAAEAVRDRGGDEEFVRFVHLLYERQRQLDSILDLIAWAGEVGVDVRDAFTNAAYDAQVDADVALAKELGVVGVPAFRINGIALSGAQPYEKFEELVDGELAEARKLKDQGRSLRQVYDQRVAINVRLPNPTKPRRTPVEDLTAYQIPVGQSPVAGPADALVTIVEFAGYQCPFCGRVQPTLRALQAKYGPDIRIVFKHNPLAFHTNSKPAALVALEVYQRLGNAAFWRFSEELFDHQHNLAESELYRLGSNAGLSQAQIKAALSSQNHERTILADQDVADAFQARGTPHFFINGVRLAGAQPQAKFEAAIDRELEKARAFVKRGVPRNRVYAEIMKTATPAPPPALKPVPPVRPFQPKFGSPTAPIKLYLFADLECPFCARLFPTLLALEKKYRGKLQIIWFDLPLPFHTKAVRDAQVAHEVKTERGDAAFWQFAEALYKDRNVAQGGDPPIVALAGRYGANGSLVQSAIGAQKHQARIEYGAKVARALGITGTPASIINGYYLSGAQSQIAFERLITRALADQRAGKKQPRLDPAKIQ